MIKKTLTLLFISIMSLLSCSTKTYNFPKGNINEYIDFNVSVDKHDKNEIISNSSYIVTIKLIDYVAFHQLYLDIDGHDFFKENKISAGNAVFGYTEFKYKIIEAHKGGSINKKILLFSITNELRAMGYCHPHTSFNECDSLKIGSVIKVCLQDFNEKIAITSYLSESVLSVDSI